MQHYVDIKNDELELSALTKMDTYDVLWNEKSKWDCDRLISMTIFLYLCFFIYEYFKFDDTLWT